MRAADAGETGAEPAQLSLGVLRYADRQLGLDRVRVSSPYLALNLPLGAQWRFEAKALADAVSGASPRYHTAISGASAFREDRRAGEIRVTRHHAHGSWALGAAASDENDFHSRTVSGRVVWDSEDRNRSTNAVLALTRDRIGSVDVPGLKEHRQTWAAELGLTQALTREDLVQASVGLVRATGYMSDPYKGPDLRPRERQQAHVLVRWNHHVEAWDTSLRAHYRRHGDSFGSHSHTLGLEAAIELRRGLSVTPSLRLYSQDAARFYYDPVYAYQGVPYPPGYFQGSPVSITADQRLAAFGAATLGLDVRWDPRPAWRIDAGFYRYEQRTAWHWRTPGSRGLAPLRARWLHLGLTRSF